MRYLIRIVFSVFFTIQCFFIMLLLLSYYYFYDSFDLSVELADVLDEFYGEYYSDDPGLRNFYFWS